MNNEIERLRNILQNKETQLLSISEKEDIFQAKIEALEYENDLLREKIDE